MMASSSKGYFAKATRKIVLVVEIRCILTSFVEKVEPLNEIPDKTACQALSTKSENERIVNRSLVEGKNICYTRRGLAHAEQEIREGALFWTTQQLQKKRQQQSSMRLTLKRTIMPDLLPFIG